MKESNLKPGSRFFTLLNASRHPLLADGAMGTWLHAQGIEHIWLDSDGDVSSLIPIWLDSGIDVLWPFECQSGMDVVEVRSVYGRDLAMMGGIDKRALVRGGDVMKRRIDRIMPLVEEGGYIPELDHSVPPDVSWPNFCEYVEYLKLRLGRG